MRATVAAIVAATSNRHTSCVLKLSRNASIYFLISVLGPPAFLIDLFNDKADVLLLDGDIPQAVIPHDLLQNAAAVFLGRHENGLERALLQHLAHVRRRENRLALEQGGDFPARHKGIEKCIRSSVIELFPAAH